MRQTRVVLAAITFVACTPKAPPVLSTPSPVAATVAPSETRPDREAGWDKLLALAVEGNQHGLASFSTQDAVLGRLRELLLSDLSQGRFREGSCEPLPVDQPMPEVGEALKKGGVMSPGIAQVLISDRGIVTRVEWVKPIKIPGVGAASDEALRTWRYRPAIRDGRFTSFELAVVVRF